MRGYPIPARYAVCKKCFTWTNLSSVSNGLCTCGEKISAQWVFELVQWKRLPMHEICPHKDAHLGSCWGEDGSRRCADRCNCACHKIEQDQEDNMPVTPSIPPIPAWKPTLKRSNEKLFDVPAQLAYESIFETPTWANLDPDEKERWRSAMMQLISITTTY